MLANEDTTVGSDLASAEVMLGTKVTKVLDKLQTPGSESWPARYMVEIADVGDGTFWIKASGTSLSTANATSFE